MRSEYFTGNKGDCYKIYQHTLLMKVECAGTRFLLKEIATVQTIQGECEAFSESSVPTLDFLSAESEKRQKQAEVYILGMCRFALYYKQIRVRLQRRAGDRICLIILLR